MVYTDIYISLVSSMEIKKDAILTLSKLKIYISERVVEEPGNHALSYLQNVLDLVFIRQELMHILEDTEIPSEQINEVEVITHNFYKKHILVKSYICNKISSFSAYL